MTRKINWRRHWRLVAVTGGIAAVLALALGGWRVAALTSSHGVPEPVSDADVVGTVDLFDPAVVHAVEVAFDQAEYEAAIDTFVQDGEKDYIQADVTIDGTRVEEVGIRLKGNSTLFGLAGSDDSGGGPQAPALGGSGSASADYPEDLPWLIDFDQFVDGQTYQGHEQIAVRPGALGSAQSTALNEALSLTLIEAAGEPAEAASYTAFSVNGSEPTLRLLVENPDDAFVSEEFTGAGVLYKALAGTDGGSFTYRGEDPLAYEDSFRQVTAQNSADLAPLIEFIQWTEDSSDEEFAAGLAGRLDVESFARYLALHNLLLDADDMSGPGQNYYLYHDLETECFTVVSWDTNSTFRGDTARGPYESGTIGGPGGMAPPGLGGAPQPGPGGQLPPGQGGFPGGGQVPEGQASPGGVTPPEGFTPPEGLTPPDGTGSGTGQIPADGTTPTPPEGLPNDQGGGLGAGGHILKERFLEVPAFQEIYEEAYRSLYQQLFADGEALAALDAWASTLGTADQGLVDAAALANDVAQLREVLEARASALAADAVITE